jgi:hypothetical protein
MVHLGVAPSENRYFRIVCSRNAGIGQSKLSLAALFGNVGCNTPLAFGRLGGKWMSVKLDIAA